jgi:hypothetical protein
MLSKILKNSDPATEGLKSMSIDQTGAHLEKMIWLLFSMVTKLIGEKKEIRQTGRSFVQYKAYWLRLKLFHPGKGNNGF